MRLVVVTGMSGSGKRTALKMLEDMGFSFEPILIDLFGACVGEEHRAYQGCHGYRCARGRALFRSS